MYRSLLVTFLLFLTLTTSVWSNDYKEFEYSRSQTKYIEFRYDTETNQMTITGFTDDKEESIKIDPGDLKNRDGNIYFNNALLFEKSDLLINNIRFSLDSISDSRVISRDDYVTCTLLKRSSSKPRLYTFKSGNLVETETNLDIKSDQFIRGFVLAVNDIAIEGEVNKDVIALKGDIKISSSASVRGDIVAFNGKVATAKDAAIYGEIYEPSHNKSRLHRYWRGDNSLNFDGTFSYNRVDGLKLALTADYNDLDSVLPQISAEFGYAFASERVRFNLDLRQKILDEPNLMLNGAVYHQLLSEDDWLLSDNENTAFALLFTEDYKDYYESFGGSIGLSSQINKDLSASLDYNYYETNWRRAHRHLWSLIGGDKLFDYNFGTVDPLYRAYGIEELDTTSNGALVLNFDYDNLHDFSQFENSAWIGNFKLEWSDSKFNSDFDYRRYILTLKRIQNFNNYLSLAVKFVQGNSDGYLPMYKRYFLGGLGSIHGYGHKEYMGSRFWMLNSEYRFKRPNSGFVFYVLWDMGQIANDQKLNGDIEIKQSLGLGISYEDDVMLILSKRLDRSTDDYPKLYARFSYRF